MRGIIKSSAIVAAIGVVAWLARNRLMAPAPVDVVDHPGFRTGPAPASPAGGPPSNEDGKDARPDGVSQDADAEHPAGAVVPGDGDDLTEIVGIGPVFRDRLAAAGIASFAALADADPATLADRVNAGEALVGDWVEQARDRSTP